MPEPGPEEGGDGLFPAAPPLAVTRMADVQRRLDECEDALRFTDEECGRRGTEIDRLRAVLRAIADPPDRPCRLRYDAASNTLFCSWCSSDGPCPWKPPSARAIARNAGMGRTLDEEENNHA